MYLDTLRDCTLIVIDHAPSFLHLTLASLLDLGKQSAPNRKMSAAVYRIQEHTVPTSHIREYPRATIDDQEEVLHLAVKQYTPRDSFRTKSEVTVIGAHANGFPKVKRTSPKHRFWN